MGSAMLLIFTKTGCSSCELAMTKASEWQQSMGNIRLRLLTSSDRASLTGADPLVLDEAFFGAKAAKEAFGVTFLPAAVLLGTNGLIATEVVVGVDAIGELVNAIAQVSTRN